MIDGCAMHLLRRSSVFTFGRHYSSFLSSSGNRSSISTLHISNIPYHITELDLQAIVAPHGSQRVWLSVGPSGKSRGRAQVLFHNFEKAQSFLNRAKHKPLLIGHIPVEVEWGNYELPPDPSPSSSQIPAIVPNSDKVIKKYPPLMIFLRNLPLKAYETGISHLFQDRGKVDVTMGYTSKGVPGGFAFVSSENELQSEMLYQFYSTPGNTLYYEDAPLVVQLSSDPKRLASLEIDALVNTTLRISDTSRMSEDNIRELAESHGEIKRIDILFDIEGFRADSTLVTFEDLASADSMYRSFQTQSLDNYNSLQVRWDTRSLLPPVCRPSILTTNVPTNTLHVDNVSIKECSDTEYITDVFSSFGPISKLTSRRNFQNHPDSAVQIQYFDVMSAEKAMDGHTLTIDGHPLDVYFAPTRILFFEGIAGRDEAILKYLGPFYGSNVTRILCFSGKSIGSGFMWFVSPSLAAGAREILRSAIPDSSIQFSPTVDGIGPSSVLYIHKRFTDRSDVIEILGCRSAGIVKLKFKRDADGITGCSISFNSVAEATSVLKAFVAQHPDIPISYKKLPLVTERDEVEKFDKKRLYFSNYYMGPDEFRGLIRKDLRSSVKDWIFRRDKNGQYTGDGFLVFSDRQAAAKLFRCLLNTTTIDISYAQSNRYLK